MRRDVCFFSGVFFAHLFIMHNGLYQTEAIHKSHAKERNAPIFA